MLKSRLAVAWKLLAGSYAMLWALGSCCGAAILTAVMTISVGVGCRSNPYHNSTHAADVVQALTCMLLTDQLNRHFADLEILAMLIAAIVHDVGHPGVTNQFLRAAKVC